MASSAAPAASVSVESAIAAAKRRLHAASAGSSTAESRPPRSSSTRSAARSTRGSCVATSTAPRARQRLEHVDDPLGRAASRCAVGSSSSRSGARRRSARANATRRCSPAESVVHLRIEPNGQPARRRAQRRPRSRRPTGVAEPHRVGDAARLEQRPLRHPGELPAPGGRADRREIDAGDGRPAGIRVDEAEEQREERRLAGAARPDDRHTLARLQLEVDAVQHPPALRVGDSHLLEPQNAGLGRGAGRRLPAPRARSARTGGRRRRARRRSHGTAPTPCAAARRARARARGSRTHGDRATVPWTSRIPSSTATTAVPSDAASSSANADRKAMRSVDIVARR